MQVLDILGSSIAYRYRRATDGGTGRPTLLFCHALASHSAIWDATSDIFADAANRLMFDLPGHGRSGCAADQSFEFADLAGIARALLEHLAIARVCPIGVSVGGEVAQAFAALYPDRTERLVLSSTACHTAPARAALWAERVVEVENGGMAGIAAATARRWFSPAFATRHFDAVRACADAIANTDPAAYLRLAPVIARMDLRTTNRAIAAPTLITFGSEDHNTGAAAAALIASTISGAQTIEFKGSGHFPHLEDAVTWNRAVGAFIFPPLE